MRRDERKRFHSIMSTQSHTRETGTMRKLMVSLLQDAGMRTKTKDGNVFATKGSQDGPVPIFVAHLDTVHPHIGDRYKLGAEPSDGDFVYWAYDKKTGKPSGVGGDDKCGLWVALEAARLFDNCRVVLTRDEEIGAVGARVSPHSWYRNASVVIQADRRGNADAVNEACGVRLSSDEWQQRMTPIISAHGYDWSTGGLTDVSELCELNKITTSAINISAGYYNPHTPDEYVVESDVENALSLAIAIAQFSEGRTWDVPDGDRVDQLWGKWSKAWTPRYRSKTLGLDGWADDFFVREEQKMLDENDRAFEAALKCPTCAGSVTLHHEEDAVTCSACGEYTHVDNAMV